MSTQLYAWPRFRSTLKYQEVGIVGHPHCHRHRQSADGRENYGIEAFIPLPDYSTSAIDITIQSASGLTK